MCSYYLPYYLVRVETSCLFMHHTLVDAFIHDNVEDDDDEDGVVVNMVIIHPSGLV